MIPWGEKMVSSRLTGAAAAQPSSAGMKGAAAADTPRARRSWRRDVVPLPRLSILRCLIGVLRRPRAWTRRGALPNLASAARSCHFPHVRAADDARRRVWVLHSFVGVSFRRTVTTRADQ